MAKKELNRIPWDIIVNILTGVATEDQKIEFQNWLNAGNNWAYFNRIEEVWQQTGSLSDLFSGDTNNAWVKVKKQTIDKVRKTKIKQLVYWSTSVAASLLLILYIGITINSRRIIISTNNDLVLNYLLPDTSKIDLKFNSQLKYYKNFNKKQREVWLKGEAYFDVKRDTKAPFIIYTTHGSFKVLGTSFSISSYESDSLVALFVNTGTVEFFADTSKTGIKVNKGEQITYNINQKKLEKLTSLNENYMAWKTGELKFNDSSMEEVVKILESSFNAKIILAGDSIINERLTADFKNQPIDKIVNVLAITFNLQVEKSNETFTLKELSK